MFANSFSHSVGCPFAFLLSSFAMEMSFLGMQSHFFTFAFVACALGVIRKKSSPRPKSRSIIPVFSYKSFMVAGLIFKSLLHFKLIFVTGIRYLSSSVLSHLNICVVSTAY